MPRHKKTIQLRRCAHCHTVGHNRATCTVSQKQAEAPATPAPHASKPPVLKFFVHHVNTNPLHSSHTLNLKTGNAPAWQKISSLPPTTPAPDLYQSYHERPAKFSKPVEPPISNGMSTLAKAPPLTKHTVNTAEEPLARASNDTSSTFALSGIITASSVIKKESVGTASQPTQPPKKIWLSRLPSISLQRIAAVILVLALAYGIPSQARSYYGDLKNTKAAVTSSALSGFKHLQQTAAAIKSGRLDEAAQANKAALDDFNTSLSNLHDGHELLETTVSAIPFINREFRDREKLLEAGEEIALGNKFILQAAQNMGAVTEFTQKYNVVYSALHTAVPNYEQALNNLRTTNPDVVPAEYRDQLGTFTQLLSLVVHDAKNVVELGSVLPELTGQNGFRRYLIIFQNEHELRPTGGFIGSFAVAEVDNGRLTKLDIPPGGSYDLQGQLDTTIIPPTPLLMTNNRWEFQDANWFPDFPTSAKKLLWFYRHSRGMSADGVIAINGSVLERLLTLLGPVNDPKRNLTLTSANALETLQQVVETGPEKQDHRPKQIITDLTPQFISRLNAATPALLIPLIQNASEALEQKEIQAYFTDNQTEATVSSFGWSGSIIATEPFQDYLSVINTNIEGEKSDASITQTIDHQAVVNADGSIIDTVTISRSHNGQNDQKLYGTPNTDYLRIYVPAGSTLLQATGFSWPDDNNFRAPALNATVDSDLQQQEKLAGIDNASGTRITQEFGKTVFGNWIITNPGETSQVSFTYRLPFSALMPLSSSSWIPTTFRKNDTAHYQLVVQKQAGITSNFQSQIIFPVTWHTLWSDGNDVVPASNGLTINSQPLTHDMVWSLLTEPAK